MAFDFQLTNRGDIMFMKSVSKRSPFKLSFLPQKGIKIGFDIVDSLPITPANPHAFRLSFELKDIENNKDVMCVSGNDNSIQAINIRLRTPIGDVVDNLNLGSKLELIKHKNIADPAILRQAESYVKAAISDIVTNPQVIAEPGISYATNFSQCINLYIYENGDLLYNTQIMR